MEALWRVLLLPRHRAGDCLTIARAQCRHLRLRKSGSEGLIRTCKPQCPLYWSFSNRDCTNRGGGNAENADMNRGVPSLRWLSYESTQAGLHLHTFDNSQYTGWDKPEINSSMTGLWWLLEVLPLQRLSYKDASSVTWW